MTKKTLLPTNDVYIQFTEEELSSIGAGPGTKFEAKLHEDGSIELKPYVKVELDMGEWSRELLECLIKESCESDVSVSEIINKQLKKFLDRSLDEDINIESAHVNPDEINNDTSILNS